MFACWAAWNGAVILQLIELKSWQQLNSIDPEGFEIVQLLNEA